ncbi:MAG TPA: SDR family oxidoreductase [Polyangiaceae bacterium]|nr:SDR family oxidoreductase [Polyangiaceae bacterium]
MPTNETELEAVEARGEGHATSRAGDVAACVDLLEAMAKDPALLSDLDESLRRRLTIAAGRVSRPDREQRRTFAKAVKQKELALSKAEDEFKLTRSKIRELRRAPVFVTPEPAALTASSGGSFDANAEAPPAEAPEPGVGELNHARSCYVCKTAFNTVHSFYDQMCTSCGDFNLQKRTQTADLSGRVALISGARVKIGYQAAILLLRAGARVIVSTRFPRDAAERYAREKDFSVWKDRLSIYGLDLRHTPSVETFARHLHQRLDRLDFVIHNACQTVRRPSGYYGHLMQRETAELGAIAEPARALLADYEALRSDMGQPTLIADGNAQRTALFSRDALGVEASGLVAAAALSQIALVPEDRTPSADWFPSGKLDADLQQLDLREVNSWRLVLDQVSTVELLEVQLVNAIAPFVLNARLRSLMCKQRTFDKHIVNVSAMEGQFYRTFKTDKHPHTNMAKAALNMMTRTSAADYAKDGIYMNSVDTGWVTDEDVAFIAERKTRETGFQPPLDIVDGAARIVDPIFDGFRTGRHAWGQFLKDYRPTAW